MNCFTTLTQPLFVLGFRNFPPKNFKPCPNRKGNTCVFNGKEFHRIGYYAIFVQSRNELGNANKTSVFEVEHLGKFY